MSRSTAFFAAYKQYTPDAKLILEYEKADNRQILDSVEYIRAFF